MADLTSIQLSDLRADIGDETSPYAFSDAELQRLFDRVDSNYYETVLLALRQLIVNAPKFRKYVAGFTRDEPDAVFKNLVEAYDILQDELRSGTQAQTIGIGFRPPYSTKDGPSDA